MPIVFFALGIAVLVGCTGGAVALWMGMLPEGLMASMPSLLGIGTSAAAGVALVGVGLAFKSMSRLNRAVGGNSMSSRIRRTRMLERSKTEGREVPEAEELSEDAEVKPARDEGARPMRRLGK